MIASARHPDVTARQVGQVGFRIAFVPEPSTLSLLALGAVAVRRRRR
jgi:hypothetical protein